MDYIDYYSDPDKKIMQSVEELPPFLAGHRAMTEKELDSLGNRAFADPAHRRFPIASRAETWRSIAYFNRQPMVHKEALLSPQSAKQRTEIRNMLAKAAQLWGLDDDEVAKLSDTVTLGVQKQAEGEEERNGFNFNGTFVEVSKDNAAEVAEDFMAHAASIDHLERIETAELVLKAAESAGAQLPPDVSSKLEAHALKGTCTARDASNAVDAILPYVPHKSASHKTLAQIRRTLDGMNADRLLLPSMVKNLGTSIASVGKKYHILKTAEVMQKLQTVTPTLIDTRLNEKRDEVNLPGGIVASRKHIASQAEWFSNWLSNHHSAEAYTPEEITDALQTLTPVELLPLRKRLGVFGA